MTKTRQLSILPRSVRSGETAPERQPPSLNAAMKAKAARIARQLDERRSYARSLYDLFEQLARRNGLHRFADFSALRALPQRGLYLIFDPSEGTDFSTDLPRIVRIGTHGVSLGSKSNLRTRLRAHFGQRDGSGNHRASIFRLHVGNALLARDGFTALLPLWGKGMSADAETRAMEAAHESRVSQYIGELLFTYVDISDEPSSKSLRAVTERALINFITADWALLDRAQPSWLGNWSPVQAIRDSGMWNIQHVGEKYDPKALRHFSRVVDMPMFGGM